MGMCEVCWNEFGETRLLKTMIFLCSGIPNSEDGHVEGVSLLLKKKIAKCNLVNWKPMCERITTARFKCQILNVTVIQRYALTEQADFGTRVVSMISCRSPEMV